MGNLSYWVETMLTLPSPNSDKPMGLVQQMGFEYLYPFIPPQMETYFVTSVPTTAAIAVRGFTCYALIFYKAMFGYIVPGAFELTLVTGGGMAYSGTINGYAMEEGIDYLFFLTPEDNLTGYITNLTMLNQYFQMASYYLIVKSEEDWNVLKGYLKRLNFPYAMPD